VQQRHLRSVSSLVKLKHSSSKWNNGTQQETEGQSALAATGGILSFMGMLSIASTQLDSSSSTVKLEPMPAPQGTSPSQKSTEDDNKDPYANLPKEDEPTECSMCNTFRQGPCRPFWRKLEHCMKDNEEIEGGIKNCMRYFYPHQECLLKYINLYDLIRLTNLQEHIEETEASLPNHQRQDMKTVPSIDWGQWDEFQKDAGIRFTQGLASAAVTKQSPLWKRFPTNTEPVVLTFSTSIPRADEDSGLLLRFAYVVDQDGMVLGVESNELYRKLKDQAEGREEIQGKGDNSGSLKEKEETEEPPGPNLQLSFLVIPCITHKIQIKALYAKDPTTIPANVMDDGRDDRLKATSFIRVGGGKA
jgi:hypothetical protein